MRGGERNTCVVRAMSWTMLRRASYRLQLRRIVITHDAYTSSMTVRIRSRPVSCRTLLT